MLAADEKKQAQLMQKANPDMIYLNDINVLVGHSLSHCYFIVYVVVKRDCYVLSV